MEVLWERLAAARPEEAAPRAGVEWDPGHTAYVVPLAGQVFRLVPAERRVDGPDGPAAYAPTLLCVQYLLSARDEPLHGEMVDPKSLPYGDFFFRGPHAMPSERIEAAFGDRPDAFRAAAAALGGRPVEMADAAAEFQALPRVPVTIALWAADEEFPARAHFLLDRAADHQLALDALWVLCGHLAKRLTSVGS